MNNNVEYCYSFKGKATMFEGGASPEKGGGQEIELIAQRKVYLMFFNRFFLCLRNTVYRPSE